MAVMLYLCKLLIDLAFTKMLQQSNATILCTYLPGDQHPFRFAPAYFYVV